MPDAHLAPLYQARQTRLAIALQDFGLDGLALNAGFSLTYLTGLHFHLSERPVVLFITPHNPPVMALPELEARKVEALSFPLEAFTYGEDPSTWVSTFDRAAHAARLVGQRVGIEPRRMRVLELRLLESAAPKTHFVSDEQAVTSLRIHKDETEIAAMRKAVEIAQQALQATLPQIRPGLTERQLAGELTQHLLGFGADPEMPFSPIVASGPNSANPHAVPTERALTAGDLLILDWGATYQGYVADLTRTFSIGKTQPEFQHIARIVSEANTAGRALAAPGVSASDVDQAARAVIEKAGYGDYFTHRTGHGIGLEGHEEPYIRSGNTQLLAPGMTFTIEPGIYLPGRGGVRIEDNILITTDGSESLSDLPRDLIVVG